MDLKDRIENLSTKSSEDYIRGFGAMLKGLEENNIKINKKNKKPKNIAR